MNSVKRIGLELLSDDLRGLISSSTKIFPVLDSYVSAGDNPGGYEFVRITDGSRRNQVFVWDSEWRLIGADDASVDWSQVEGKPVAYNPIPHSHDELYAPILHLHDGVYAPFAHNHDALYALKAHTHDGLYALVNHNHDSDYAPIVHAHDSLYAQKSIESTVLDHESRLSSIEGGYSEGHFHSNLDALELIRYTGVRNVIDLKSIENLQFSLSTKLDSSTFNGHVENSTVHVTQTDKDSWNAKADEGHVHDYSSLTGIPSSFTPSAHTHSYNDLTDKPVVADEITIGDVQPTSNLWYKVVS